MSQRSEAHEFIIVIYLLFTGVLLDAQNIQGGYGGDFNPSEPKFSRAGDIGRSISYGNFTFHDGEYILDISAGKSDKIRQEVPEIYFDSAYYSESGKYSIKKDGIYDYLYLESWTAYQYKQKLGRLISF
jgi:hypothetical protein